MQWLTLGLAASLIVSTMTIFFALYLERKQTKDVQQEIKNSIARQQFAEREAETKASTALMIAQARWAARSDD